MRIDEDDIIEQYGGEIFNGRWILPSGARVSHGGEDHRRMINILDMDRLSDVLLAGLVSVHESRREVSIRYAGWRPSWEQCEVLRPILEDAIDLYVEHYDEDGRSTSYCAPRDMEVDVLALKVLDPVAFNLEAGYDEDGYL